MHYFVTRCPSEINDILYKYLSKEFSSWNIIKKGPHLLFHPSACHCFILNSLRNCDLFQIKVYIKKEYKRNTEVPFIDIKSQLYKFYFQFIVLSKIPQFTYSPETLFKTVYIQLSTNDIFYCRNRMYFVL